MANVTSRMKSLGVSLDEVELRRLRILALGDRRSISWLLRDAVQDYLKKRKDDVLRYAVQQAMEHVAKQSEQRRAQEEEDRMAHDVKEQAAAVGISIDPASIGRPSRPSARNKKSSRMRPLLILLNRLQTKQASKDFGEMVVESSKDELKS